MTKFAVRLKRYLKRNLDALWMRVVFIPHFLKIKTQSSPRFSLRWRDKWPCYADATATTGFDKHYIYHPAWAARVLSEIKPEKHIDISSTLYFSVNVSAFIPIEFYDYRPAKIELDGLECKSGNLIDLPFKDGEVESVSCMHVIEHIGLGRYGDPLDYDGDLKAARELMRVTKEKGCLLIVVPIGGEALIQFNAHRIYTYDNIIHMFAEMSLVEFSLIPDKSEQGLIRHASKEISDMQRYGCGCFHFQKLSAT